MSGGIKISDEVKNISKEEMNQIIDSAYNEAKEYRLRLIRYDPRLNQRNELADLIRQEIEWRYPRIKKLLNNWQDTTSTIGAYKLKKMEELLHDEGKFEEVKEVVLTEDNNDIITKDLFIEYLQVIGWNQEYYNYKYYKEREGKILYRGYKSEEIKNQPLQSFTSKRSVANKFGYKIRECKVTKEEIRFIPELLPNRFYAEKEREFIISKEV